MRRLLVFLAAMSAIACGTPPSGVVTNPPGGGTASTGTPVATPGGPQQSGTRTVLSPLGLNLRSGPSASASRLIAAARGAELTVIGYSADSGGWYHVQGATTTGWISADPSLSATGTFLEYASTAHSFSVLYPTVWTFAEEPSDVVFRPQSGPDSVVMRTAANIAALGNAGAPGYGATKDTEVVVCGVTSDLITYDRGSGASASPSGPGSAGLAHLAQIRLKLDEAHALGMDFNYADVHGLDTFANFYNSTTFPFPQCQRSAPATP